jgi:hypothetical protein
MFVSYRISDIIYNTCMCQAVILKAETFDSGNQQSFHTNTALSLQLGLYVMTNYIWILRLMAN